MRALGKIVLLIMLVLALLGAISWMNYNFDLDSLTGIFLEDKNNINSFVQDQGSIRLYFCPREDCETAFISFLDSAQQSLHCALFEVELESLKNKLLEKEKVIDVRIVTDNDYLKQFNYSFAKADSWGLMHNKFCVVDGKKVSTGSMNPTNNDAHKNNNNLLLIESSVLAGNYEDEFWEMWNGTFKRGNQVKNPSLKLGNITLQNYFCPEDNCAEHVKDELKNARKSIYFMTFAFTNEGIANIILLKNMENITIQGVMEARQVTKDSKYEVLHYQLGNDKVLKDANKNNMHHKVFIIDEETVVTGSFNPTAGGDRRNDENVLIIKDKVLAQRFMEEFWNIYTAAQKH